MADQKDQTNPPIQGTIPGQNNTPGQTIVTDQNNVHGQTSFPGQNVPGQTIVPGYTNITGQTGIPGQTGVQTMFPCQYKRAWTDRSSGAVLCYWKSTRFAPGRCLPMHK